MGHPMTSNSHPALEEIASRITVEDAASALVEDFRVEAGSDDPIQIRATLEVVWTGSDAEEVLAAIQSRRAR